MAGEDMSGTAAAGAGAGAGSASGAGGESEAAALARWCAGLAELREQARVTGVGERLERDADRVRQGGSARRAVGKWLQGDGGSAGPGGPARSWSDRGATAMAGFPGSPRTPSAGAGRYGCPSGRCDRTAGRDAQGHLPACHAYGTAMRPVAARAEPPAGSP
ncbi:hypothetical protein [Streptomyces sp. NPDC007369]|uniref:hypothetical protein n=1 Tax=Streptomyces sp. NPDC007369 TaxID=3154589 RepID=UPI003408D4B5